MSPSPNRMVNTTKECTMAGRFEVYTDAAGKYRFRLKAGNGEVIAVGEAYESKAGALSGIESVKQNASDAAIVDQTT
jgi:uncharacterized protein YegP (UPF0339 family)